MVDEYMRNYKTNQYYVSLIEQRVKIAICF